MCSRSIVISASDLQGRDEPYMNPAYTSQTCHSCGHVAKGNRLSQSKFKCTACGHADDADVNAALNWPLVMGLLDVEVATSAGKPATVGL